MPSVTAETLKFRLAKPIDTSKCVAIAGIDGTRSCIAIGPIAVADTNAAKKTNEVLCP